MTNKVATATFFLLEIHSLVNKIIPHIHAIAQFLKKKWESILKST
jgi:hypothetical protein